MVMVLRLEKGKGHSFVTVGLDDSFTIRNNENEYLTWDGNSFREI